MNWLAEIIGNPAGGAIGVVLFFLLVSVLKAFIRVCPPNQVLVVTGTKTDIQGKEYGFRIQRGGWTMVIPYFQRVQTLDLSIIPINVRVEGVNSANGITVGADATACVCVDVEDETLLYAAVQNLMDKTRGEIQDQIQQTMIGNVRGALNKTTPLQAIGMVESAEDGRTRTGDLATLDAEGERAQFRLELLKDSNQDLSSFGMKVVSVSLQKIWDTSDYIANLANKTLSRKRQEVAVEVARLRARAERAESDAKRRETIAENKANEQILASQQELEVLRRQCEAEVERARLEADSAISTASSAGERTVQDVTVGLQKLKNVSMVTLEAETKQKAAEIRAVGQSEAIRIVQETQNALLTQKAQLVADAGNLGKTALFVRQQLPYLFKAYQEYAKTLEVDNVVMMDEDGLNGLLNRGPEAFVDFLKLFEDGLGIRVRDLLAVGKEEEAAS